MEIIPRFRYKTKLSLHNNHKVCDLANAQVFIYMKLNSFITDFKFFCFVIVLGALLLTELSNKLVFLSGFSYFERITKISKVDRINTMD